MNETQDITMPTLAAISQLQGACFYRQNCGKFRTMDGRRVLSATSISGIADIMGVYEGRAVAIETKTKTGKQLTSQKTFQRNWERSGGVYIIARHPDDAVQALRWIAP